MGNTSGRIKCNRAILCYPNMVAPRYHELPSPVEEVRAPVGRFDSVWVDVGKRLLGQFAWLFLLAAPLP